MKICSTWFHVAIFLSFSGRESFSSASASTPYGLQQGRSLGMQQGMSQDCTVQSSGFSHATLSDDTLARSVALPGEPWMWAKLRRRFCSGSPLKLLVLGGSVEMQPWVKLLCDWLQSTRPGSACIVGAHGSVGSKWVYEHLDDCGSAHRNISIEKPDIIILDTSVNPWSEDKAWNVFLNISRESYYVEKIARKILQYVWQPFLLPIEWMSFWDNVAMAPHYLTNQDYHFHVYSYYGIPVCSFRNALWPHLISPTNDVTSRAQPAFKLAEIIPDKLHPSELGGQLMVDMITYNIARGVPTAGPSSDTRLPPLLMTRNALKIMYDAKNQWNLPIPGGPMSPPLEWRKTMFFGHDNDNVGSSDGVGLGGKSRADPGMGKWGQVQPDLGNHTQEVKDMILLFSGSALLGWEVLCSRFGAPARFASGSPDPLPLSGNGLVRIYGMLHIAAMHYYQLTPARLQILQGYPSFVRWGRYWVQMFFLMSGFVAYLSEDRGIAGLSGSSTTFLLKRVGVLYPTFALSLVIAYMSEPGQEILHEDPKAGVLTTCLLQTWVRPHGWVAFNGPSWYLSTLFTMYIGFPRWLKQVQHSTRPVFLLAYLWLVAFLLGGVLSLGSSLGGLSVSTLLESGLASFLDFHPACSWHIFLMGVTLARVVRSHMETLKKTRLSMFGASGCLSALTLIFLFVEIPDNSVLGVLANKSALLFPLFGCMLVSIALNEDVMFGIRLWDCPLFADWLPGCAWCLYILHVPLFFYCRETLEQTYEITAPMRLVGLAFIASAAVNTIFDKPVRFILKRYVFSRFRERQVGHLGADDTAMHDAFGRELNNLEMARHLKDGDESE